MKDLHDDRRPDGKFRDPKVTLDGSARASVRLTSPKTLWFNTGTVCNITCENCYIESSPTNDRLDFLQVQDVRGFLKQLRQRDWPVREIGFTGGEPFMNPEIIEMISGALSAGFEVLVLTNAMLPMMRARVREGLLALERGFPGRMTLRVSLDHYTARLHDQVRGRGSFAKTMIGLRWLRDNGLQIAVAGRNLWDESERDSRNGFAGLFARENLKIDAQDPVQTVLFPEMDASAEVPEITTACWDILGKKPSEVMCSSSRMVVRRKGARRPAVLACTLLAYEPEFELGNSLEEAERDVWLNHPHCAKFCVLGGASCSA